MRKTRGFSVMEIIVVIAIIAILAIVVLPHMFNAVEKAKISKVMEDIANLRAAATGYYSDIGIWPPDVCPHEDPGFVRWDVYKDRCCGQDDTSLEAMAYNATGDTFETMIHNYWDGPYLEKFPHPTPWAGDYDYEFWPTGGYSQPAGIYISVRTRWIGQPSCTGNTNDPKYEVPDRFEIKMQQMGYDTHCGTTFDHTCTAANRKTPSGLVIIPLLYLNQTN